MFGISVLLPIRARTGGGGSSGAPYITNPGTLSGAVVGTESTASSPSYTGDDVTLAYQWYADSVPISGETDEAFTPTAAQDGKLLQLQIRATNSSGQHSRFTPGIMVTRVAPTASGTIPSQSFSEDSGVQTLDITSYFTGGGLAYSLVSDGGLATINAGVISFDTSEDLDVVSITVRATNSGGYADQTFSTTIVVAAPTAIGTLSNRSYIQGTGVQTIAAASAFAGKYLTFSLTAGGGIASINASTGVVSIPTVSAYSATTVTVQAENSGGTVTRSFTATVAVAAPQVVGTISDRIVTVGSDPATISTSGVFSGASLTYSISPAGVASINSSTGVITIDDSAIAAAKTFTVTATNATGSASTTFAVTVNDIAPALVAPIANQSLTQGGSAVVIDLSSVFSGENLTLSLSQGATVASLNAGAETLTISTATVTAGTTVRVQAANTGGTASATFTVVVGVAAPSVSGSLSNRTLYVGAASPYIAATDAFTGMGLSFAVTAGNSLASVHPTTGVVTLITTSAGGGTVTIEAANSAGTASVSFTVTILIAVPAVVAPIADQSFDEQTGVQTINAGAAFSGESLTFSLTAGGSIATINSSTGVVSIPTTSVVSGATVRVRATNSSGYAEDVFLVSIVEVATGDPRVPYGYSIAARPALAAGQFYICFTAPSFWGDAEAGGDGLGAADYIYMTVGGYKYALYGTYETIGSGEIGTSFIIGPAPDAIDIDDVRGLPIGQAAIGESFVIGPIPASFWADGMDDATCFLLDTPTDLHGQTVDISVWAVNDYGVAGGPVTDSITLSSETPDTTPENALTSRAYPGEVLTSRVATGEILTSRVV